MAERAVDDGRVWPSVVVALAGSAVVLAAPDACYATSAVLMTAAIGAAAAVALVPRRR